MWRLLTRKESTKLRRNPKKFVHTLSAEERELLQSQRSTDEVDVCIVGKEC
jgi:hypothetical protein